MTRRIWWRSKFSGLVCVCWLSHSAIGAELLTIHDLSLSLALEAAAKAIESCAGSGFAVVVTVLDRQGVAKVVLRGDRSVPQATDTSRGKAYAALAYSALLGVETSGEAGAKLASNPALSSIQHVPGVLLIPGGVLVKHGNEVIGAVGVGGAPGGAADEVCAKAGVAWIVDRLK